MMANSIKDQKSFVYNLLLQLTNEIPNRDAMEEFIDDNVAKNIDALLKWQDVIKSSNYLSTEM